MKRFAISLCLALSLGIHAAAAVADSLVDEAVAARSWLVPNHLVVQNAGNMGLLAAGVGWGYGRKRQWETQLLVGFVPKSETDHAKPTLTLKQNFIPWNRPLAAGWRMAPLTCSGYINTVLSHEFWGRSHRFSNSYDGLSSHFTASIALGQRVTRHFAPGRGLPFQSVSAFYEVSTYDVALIDCLSNRSVSLWSTIGLSLGLSLQVK